MNRRLQIGLVALVAVAFGVWGLLQLTSSGSTERGGSTKGDTTAEFHADESSLKATALHDPVVERLAAGGRVSVVHAIPWTSPDGKSLEGSGIELTVQPEVSVKDQKLPAYVTPGDKAPPGTPALHRFASYSATGVSLLRLRVSLHPPAVVEVVPDGENVEITKAHLIGPSPGKAYMGNPGE